MSSDSDRRHILEMVEAGKISAAQAAEIFKGGAPPEPPVAPAAPEAPSSPVAFRPATDADLPAAGKGPSWFHVRVSDSRSGKVKVSVNIPLRLLKFGLRFGSKFSPEMRGMDWDDLSAMLNEAGSSVLVDVQDEEDGEHVQIYVD